MRRTWRLSEAKQGAEARARGAGEALGGNGDDVFRQSERERAEEENGRALSECGAPWRPCQRRRPDERGRRRRTGAIWRTDVALGVHDGELGSESELAIVDCQSNFGDE